MTWQKQLGNIKGDENYAALYYYESLSITVSNNRICSLEWMSPMDVVAVENKNVSCLSFEEIMELFKKQMQIEATAGNMANEEQSDVKMIEAKVDKIEFGLVRIRIPDNEREFYLVPAWTFTGEIGMDYGNGVSFYSDSFQDALISAREFETIYQIINSVDGTFIDVRKGY